MNHKAFYNGIVETYKKAGLKEENLLKDVLCIWNSLHPWQKQAVAMAAVSNWEVEIGGWPYCREEMHKMAKWYNPASWGWVDAAGTALGVKDVGSFLGDASVVGPWAAAKSRVADMSNTAGQAAGRGQVQGALGAAGDTLKQWAPYLIGPALGALGGGMMGGWRGALAGGGLGLAGAYGYSQMQDPNSWLSKQWNTVFPGQQQPQQTAVKNPQGQTVNVSTPKPSNIPAAGTVQPDAGAQAGGAANVLATDPSKNKLQQQQVSGGSH